MTGTRHQADDLAAAVGLEVHVQLRTRTKIFCGCPNRVSSPPNTDVCPVCLGYPGAMPVLNRRAVELTIRTGLLLGCRINPYSKWDRKNYFYPDMPKNYQISQYDLPLCLGGGVPIEHDGETRVVRLTRIHLEEDVAKNMHFAGRSGIDFNRAGTPLMEIVTEPDMTSADEAFAFLLALKQILAFGDISDCNLEEGNIRCDINCSVRPAGQAALGTKTEIKNMNTFKGVHRALSYELKRQAREVGKGGHILQETRRWDDEAGVTLPMRSKEYAHDYRYFPEPDLVPAAVSEAQVQALGRDLPELPMDRRRRFQQEYGLPAYDAGVLTADRAVADYYEEAARASGNHKAVSNWVMGEMMRALGEQNAGIREARITPAALAALVRLTDDQLINQTAAKEVFQALFAHGGDPLDVVRQRGLAQLSDTGAIDTLVTQVLDENPRSVADFRAGREQALQFLVGQVMRLSRGNANPQRVLETLRERLG
jgi:aspartyl-tRNA(Asn)/glutamyl-tRNA(Gln) amidotransferase subunit B